MTTTMMKVRYLRAQVIDWFILLKRINSLFFSLVPELDDDDEVGGEFKHKTSSCCISYWFFLQNRWNM